MMVGTLGGEVSGWRGRWRLCTRIIPCLLLLTAVACSDSAGELWDAATLEEQQRNHAHAAELYRELIGRYPDSPEAVRARDRLRALKRTGQ